MMIHLNSLVCLISLIFVLNFSQAQEINKILGFAKSLHAEGEYYRAITEYKRVLFFAPAESILIRETALLGVGGALFSGMEYSRSAEWLNTHLNDFIEVNTRKEAILLMCRGFLKDYEGARLITVIDELNDIDSEIKLYMGLAYASIGRWNNASAIFQDLKEDKQIGHIASNYAVISKKGEQASWKSPRTAIFLNIIPGAGYFYAGHKQTAFASFIVNTIFFFATIQAFKTDQNVLGGFLSLLSVSWYAGNIYGSAKAARRYNDKLQEKIWSQYLY